MPEKVTRTTFQSDQRQADRSPAAAEVCSTSIAPEGVDLSEMRFDPILTSASLLLAKAKDLADWEGDGPIDETTQILRFKVAMGWLDLEAALSGAGLVDEASVLVPCEWYESGDPRLRAFKSSKSLTEHVRAHSDWRNYLPARLESDQPGIDITLIPLDAPMTMGVSPTVFAKRVTLIVEQLKEAVAMGPPAKRKMSKEEANERAIQLTEADPSFLDKSLREWAAAIDCSEGLVVKLRLWKETMKRTGRGKRGRARVPKAVSLTRGLEATFEGSKGDAPDELERLIEEQRADAEPSPLEDDPPSSKPKKVVSRTRA